MVGNFGEVFNLANLRKIANNIIINFHTLPHCAEALVIAKFKTCQCIRMTDSPNLTLAKVSRYTVYISISVSTQIFIDFRLACSSVFLKLEVPLHRYLALLPLLKCMRMRRYKRTYRPHPSLQAVA